MRNSGKIVLLLCLASILISSKSDKKYYSEQYRPQFHFSPENYNQSEPSGLIYLDGKYHMFYQHNPKGNEQEYGHWGHAVSSNLVHWEHLPIALLPDESSQDKDYCTLLSGSLIVDHQNHLKKQQDTTKTLVAFYTSKYCGQRIAYSTDKGLTWRKHEDNPILPYNNNDDARDPKVIWHDASQRYVMVLSRKTSDDEKTTGISFYTSQNLTDWEYKSHVYGFNGRPDLISMQVSNRPEEIKWVLFDGDGSYLVGQFDGEKFTTESAKMNSDFGRNYYATQTWNNIPKEDGRIIQIAWMRGGKFPDMPFDGQMTFPNELQLIKYNFGYKITRRPINEIEVLYGKHYEWENKKLIPGINQNIVKKVKGDCFHIIGEFDLKTSGNFGFYLRNSKKSTGTEVLYDVKRGTLSVMGVSAPVEPVNNKITLEILIDRTSVEVFANGGQTVISNSFTPEKGADGLLLFCTGGELMVDKLDIYKINSAWNSAK